MMVNTLKDLFEVMDVENSGCVDQLGFQVGLIHIGVNLPEETLTQVFAQVDENADGNVTYEEFSQFLKSREQTGPAQRVQEALLRCQARGITANLTNNAGLPSLTAMNELQNAITPEAFELLKRNLRNNPELTLVTSTSNYVSEFHQMFFHLRMT